MSQMRIDGNQNGEDQPGKHLVPASSLIIGALVDISEPWKGYLSEVRIWKRALADDELAMELNSAAPPPDLVRWFCFTDEDAESPEGTVKNHAPHGPPLLTVGSDSKPKWTTRADLGETEEDRTGAAKAVPRQVNRLLALALATNCTVMPSP